jgi:hypothetical protein
MTQRPEGIGGCDVVVPVRHNMMPPAKDGHLRACQVWTRGFIPQRVWVRLPTGPFYRLAARKRIARAHSATDTPERSAAARIKSQSLSGQRPIWRTGLISLTFLGGLPTGFGDFAILSIYRQIILSQYRKIPISCIDTILSADRMRADKEKPRQRSQKHCRGKNN